jgi:hypothetical protein
MNSDGLVRRECANNAFAADHDRDHIALDVLSDMVRDVLDIDPESKQSLVEMTSTVCRLKTLEVHLEETIERLKAQIAQDKVRHQVRGTGHYTS